MEQPIQFLVSVDQDFITSNHKGKFKKGIAKKQKKLLDPLAPQLKEILQPDEKVKLVTTGVSPVSLLEQWLF